MTVNYVQLAPHHFDAIIALGNEVHGDNYLDKSQLQDLYERSWSNDVNASWVAVLTQPDAISGQSIEQGVERDINQGVDQYINQDTEIKPAKRLASKQTPDGYLVGFRLTIASPNWSHDQWCTPDKWGHPQDQVCYFKCNTVDSAMRGKGVGSSLLQKSIESAKQQNALAGVAHIWMQSPGNSAFEYFTASGGKLVKKHPNKWQIHTIEDGYDCPVCDNICYCVAAEMIIHFAPFEA